MSWVKLVLGLGVVGTSGGIPTLVSEATGDSYIIDSEVMERMCVSGEDADVNKSCEVEWIWNFENEGTEIEKMNEDSLRMLGVQETGSPLAKLKFVKKTTGNNEQWGQRWKKDGYFTIFWKRELGQDQVLSRYKEGLKGKFEELCQVSGGANNNDCGAEWWGWKISESVENSLRSLSKKMIEGELTREKEKYSRVLNAIKDTFDWVWISKRK